MKTAKDHGGLREERESSPTTAAPGRTPTAERTTLLREDAERERQCSQKCIINAVKGDQVAAVYDGFQSVRSRPNVCGESFVKFE